MADDVQRVHMQPPLPGWAYDFLRHVAQMERKSVSNVAAEVLTEAIKRRLEER